MIRKLITKSSVEEEIEYPESDGKPLGETGYHVEAILTLKEVLDRFWRRRPKIFVAADMFLYYEEGNPSAVVAPAYRQASS